MEVGEPSISSLPAPLGILHGQSEPVGSMGFEGPYAGNLYGFGVLRTMWPLASAANMTRMSILLYS